MTNSSSERHGSKSILVVTVVIGVALGVFSHGSSGLPGGWRWTGNFGALWLAVAFLAGRGSQELKKGAVAGAATLALASLIHYVPHRMVREGISLHAFRWPVILWIAVGVAVGLLFGALGAAHAQGRKPLAMFGVGLLMASFAAEALVLWKLAHPKAIQVAVPIEAAAAAVLPFALLPNREDRIKVLLVALVCLPVAALGLSAFMGVIHRVYPGI